VLTKRVVGFLRPIAKRYFRSEIRDLGRIPAGGALLVSNHSGGPTTTDLPTFAVDFYDRFGCDRLAPAARELLTGLTSRLDWTWIVGNHDPGFADHCGGRIEDEVEQCGIVLRHEAVRGESRPEISGHFHPKLRLHLKGRRVSRRCFVTSATKIIMPAFGSLTGGLDAHHPEIMGSVGPNPSALVPVSDRLLRFPLAA